MSLRNWGSSQCITKTGIFLLPGSNLSLEHKIVNIIITIPVTSCCKSSVELALSKYEVLTFHGKVHVINRSGLHGICKVHVTTARE